MSTPSRSADTLRKADGSAPPWQFKPKSNAQLDEVWNRCYERGVRLESYCVAPTLQDEKQLLPLTLHLRNTEWTEFEPDATRFNLQHLRLDHVFAVLGMKGKDLETGMGTFTGYQTAALGWHYPQKYSNSKIKNFDIAPVNANFVNVFNVEIGLICAMDNRSPLRSVPDGTDRHHLPDLQHWSQVMTPLWNKYYTMRWPKRSKGYLIGRVADRPPPFFLFADIRNKETATIVNQILHESDGPDYRSLPYCAPTIGGWGTLKSKTFLHNVNDKNYLALLGTPVAASASWFLHDNKDFYGAHYVREIVLFREPSKRDNGGWMDIMLLKVEPVPPGLVRLDNVEPVRPAPDKPRLIWEPVVVGGHAVSRDGCA